MVSFLFEVVSLACPGASLQLQKPLAPKTVRPREAIPLDELEWGTQLFSAAFLIAGLSRSLVRIRRAQKLGEGSTGEVFLVRHCNQGRNGSVESR